MLKPVLRNQMTPLIIDSRVVLFRNILTPDHSVRVRVRVRVVRVRGLIYFGGSKYFVTPATNVIDNVARGSKRKLRLPPARTVGSVTEHFLSLLPSLEQSTHRPQDCYLFNGRFPTSLEDLAFQKGLRITLRLHAYYYNYYSNLLTVIIIIFVIMLLLLLFRWRRSCPS